MTDCCRSAAAFRRKAANAHFHRPTGFRDKTAFFAADFKFRPERGALACALRPHDTPPVAGCRPSGRTRGMRVDPGPRRPTVIGLRGRTANAGDIRGGHSPDAAYRHRGW